MFILSTSIYCQYHFPTCGVFATRPAGGCTLGQLRDALLVRMPKMFQMMPPRTFLGFPVQGECAIPEGYKNSQIIVGCKGEFHL